MSQPLLSEESPTLNSSIAISWPRWHAGWFESTSTCYSHTLQLRHTWRTHTSERLRACIQLRAHIRETAIPVGQNTHNYDCVLTLLTCIAVASASQCAATTSTSTSTSQRAASARSCLHRVQLPTRSRAARITDQYTLAYTFRSRNLCCQRPKNSAHS